MLTAGIIVTAVVSALIAFCAGLLIGSEWGTKEAKERFDAERAWKDTERRAADRQGKS